MLAATELVSSPNQKRSVHALNELRRACHALHKICLPRFSLQSAQKLQQASGFDISVITPDIGKMSTEPEGVDEIAITWITVV
jgi:hypothetical protein